MTPFADQSPRPEPLVNAQSGSPNLDKASLHPAPDDSFANEAAPRLLQNPFCAAIFEAAGIPAERRAQAGHGAEQIVQRELAQDRLQRIESGEWFEISLRHGFTLFACDALSAKIGDALPQAASELWWFHYSPVLQGPSIVLDSAALRALQAKSENAFYFQEFLKNLKEGGQTWESRLNGYLLDRCIAQTLLTDSPHRLLMAPGSTDLSLMIKRDNPVEMDRIPARITLPSLDAISAVREQTQDRAASNLGLFLRAPQIEALLARINRFSRSTTKKDALENLDFLGQVLQDRFGFIGPCEIIVGTGLEKPLRLEPQKNGLNVDAALLALHPRQLCAFVESALERAKLEDVSFAPDGMSRQVYSWVRLSHRLFYDQSRRTLLATALKHLSAHGWDTQAQLGLLSGIGAAARAAAKMGPYHTRQINWHKVKEVLLVLQHHLGLPPPARSKSKAALAKRASAARRGNKAAPPPDRLAQICATDEKQSAAYARAVADIKDQRYWLPSRHRLGMLAYFCRPASQQSIYASLSGNPTLLQEICGLTACNRGPDIEPYCFATPPEELRQDITCIRRSGLYDFIEKPAAPRSRHDLREYYARMLLGKMIGSRKTEEVLSVLDTPEQEELLKQIGRFCGQAGAKGFLPILLAAPCNDALTLYSYAIGYLRAFAATCNSLSQARRDVAASQLIAVYERIMSEVMQRWGLILVRDAPPTELQSADDLQFPRSPRVLLAQFPHDIASCAVQTLERAGGCSRHSRTHAALAAGMKEDIFSALALDPLAIPQSILKEALKICSARLPSLTRMWDGERLDSSLARTAHKLLLASPSSAEYRAFTERLLASMEDLPTIKAEAVGYIAPILQNSAEPALFTRFARLILNRAPVEAQENALKSIPTQILPQALQECLQDSALLRKTLQKASPDLRRLILPHMSADAVRSALGPLEADEIRSHLQGLRTGEMLDVLESLDENARKRLVLHREVYWREHIFTETLADLSTGQILPNHYAALGVPRNSPLDVLKRSYRLLALCFHPDRVATEGEQSREDAEAHFKKIAEAWEVLSDQDKRPLYDRRIPNYMQSYPQRPWYEKIPAPR